MSLSIKQLIYSQIRKRENKKYRLRRELETLEEEIAELKAEMKKQ